MDPGDKSRVCESINQELATITTENSRSFIFKLHNTLRNINHKAYEPEIIAIGPYHCDKDNLKMMEEHKLRYLKSLLESKNVNIEVYVSAIGDMEQEARKSYAEPISLDAAEFTKMLVLDGCFIIELVRKDRMDFLTEYDPIFERGWMIGSMRRDLMLFENQIPFSILCKLFDLIETPNSHHSLIDLASSFFNEDLLGQGRKLSVSKSSNEIKHLLDLVHIGWQWQYPPITTLVIDDVNTMDGQRTWRYINSATELRKANVKLKKSQGNSLFDIRFENGCLLLPPLVIDDNTESFFRNLIAYEQYFGNVEYVTDYMKFLDSLINSSADVEILCRHGIIDNWLGDAEVVSVTISKLGDSVACNGKKFSYSKIFESVNAHCERRRNTWMAILKQHHLSSPWAMISIFAAIVLLLLTATQTVFSVLN